ncbi:heme ABC transporter ATP-binding protein [Chitinophaga nivalis]|uniref:Heme ABC transporter ATP-binding protein n=1 Tax=Chitinophaga nivalis TaxID=2991709 RepID=A0ABT3IT95_9BACT|nr:heme ABC transporter ATP-binding protein [Chitinophaga nivalis]MCW3463110.1 heme ABC transporter ATP-binding protein [Chitinophaga nivalis]MCW3487200.1 heme ABC transporter ATP-binding protein [Chitinophaga nivalis]
MLSIQQVSLSFGKQPILHQISLEAAPGELCVLMGANGAGKSTLLKTIAGEYTHFTGDIQLGGQSLQQLPAAAQARCRAVLSQKMHLQLPFTVEEIVRMGRYVYHATPALDKAIIDYALQVLQIAELRERSWLTLSGGQQQRVHMARVLAQLLETPDLQTTDYAGKKMLLLDEPVTGMDIRHQQLALQLAQELTRKGVLVIAVLHDFQLAAAYADKLVLLHRGGIYAAGRPAEVLTAAHIRHCFDIDTQVLTHPSCSYPLIITTTHHLPSKKILANGNNHLLS